MTLDEELVDPDYQPEYTGDTSLGDVGSGKDFGADLYYLYRAGRNELPDAAQVYAEQTRSIHYLRGTLETLFDGSVPGRERAHQRLLDMREEAHEILRTNYMRMLQVGQALMETADTYAATDQEATCEFKRLLEANSEDYEYPPFYDSDPPAADGPVNSPPI